MSAPDYPFPSAGVPGDRMFTVGACKVCHLTLGHDERDGPPVAKEYCAVHDPAKLPPPRPKIKKKTAGEMLLEKVAARHTDRRGVGAIKMPDAARQDLIDEINGAIR